LIFLIFLLMAALRRILILILLPLLILLSGCILPGLCRYARSPQSAQ
jgi:hypothetical protein